MCISYNSKLLLVTLRVSRSRSCLQNVASKNRPVFQVDVLSTFTFQNLFFMRYGLNINVLCHKCYKTSKEELNFILLRLCGQVLDGNRHLAFLRNLCFSDKVNL